MRILGIIVLFALMFIFVLTENLFAIVSLALATIGVLLLVVRLENGSQDKSNRGKFP